MKTQTLNRDICLSSALGYTFTGENSAGSFFVRTTNAGRGSQSFWLRSEWW